MKVVSEYQAKLCWTAGGILIHNNKALLIKHKKLGIWLSPGGHIEQNELPHQAAEREFFEETGLQVKAISVAEVQFKNSRMTEYLPAPLFTNVHWISKTNYQARTANKPVQGKGCEQHLCFFYLVKPVGGLAITKNTRETLGIDWFSLSDLEELETLPEVKQELKLAFQLL